MSNGKQKNSPPTPALDSPGPLSHRFVVDNIIQAMSDGVMVVSPTGEIVLVNQALCEILGFRAEDMLGKGWAELFFDDPQNLDFNQTAVEVIQSRQPISNRQVSYHAPDGRRRVLLATTSLIYEDHKTVGLVSLFKDVTELEHLHHQQRRLLAQSLRLYEEKAESLDRIARAVAHEVRNPVTAIGGLAARLIKMHQEDERLVGYLRRILEAAGRLEQVVAQVRAYAYLPRPNRRTVDMVAWIEEVIAPYRQRCQDQGVKLNIQVSACAQCEAQIDPFLLTTAVNNILDNALEAMENGGELTVSLLHEQDELVITVQDTGPGIAREDLPYLWDPFFTTKADRVGMSLAITKRIIGEHEGLLDVESPPGGGTRVIITLPAGEPPDETHHRAPQMK